MFKIIYGDQDPFKGLAPTPFVSRGVSTIFNAQKFADINSITLDGMLTGCDLDNNEWSGTYERSKQLVSNFGSSFQRLRIVEEMGDSGISGIIFSEGYARVSSIQFQESVFAGNVPFIINLDVYDEESFESGTYGITQPSQEERFEDQGNGQINFVRTSSAQGFKTNLDAVDNARIFVQGITGGAPSIAPLTVSDSGASSGVLLGVAENINRLAGSYSVTETWSYNSLGQVNPNSIYNYTVDVVSGQDFPRVTVRGEVIGSAGGDMDLIRDDFNSLAVLDFAEQAYSGAGFSGTLNPEPMSRSINEEKRRIDFSYEYSDQVSGDPFVIDRFRVNSTFEQPKKCIRGSVSIRSNTACLEERWSRVNDYYQNFDPMEWVSGRMEEYGYDFEIPSQPATISTQFDERTARIDVSIGLCETVGGIPSGFNQFDYTVNVTPSQPAFVPYQGLDCSGQHIVQKLNGLNRKTVEIQGAGVKNSCLSQAEAKSNLADFINSIKNDYLIGGTDTFLTRDSVVFGDTERPNNLSFNFGWNQESDLEFDSGIFQGSSYLTYTNQFLLFTGDNLAHSP